MANLPELPNATICGRDPDCSSRDLSWAEKQKTPACRMCIIRWYSQNNIPIEEDTVLPVHSNPDLPTTRSGKRIVDQGF